MILYCVITNKAENAECANIIETVKKSRAKKR